MASQGFSSPKVGRAAWGAIFVGLAVAVIAVGGRLNRPEDVSALRANATAASAAHVPLPALAEAASSTAAVTASAVATASVAVPSVAHPPVVDELPMVRKALEGGASPEETLKAANALLGCKGADGAVQTLYKMRDQADPAWKALNKQPGINMDALIVDMQASQRRCQVFDSSTLARAGELYARAYEAGAKGSALPYLQSLIGEGKQAANPELVRKLQQESRLAAQDGDFAALTAYSHGFGSSLGITEVQRQGFKEAWLRIQGEMSGSAIEKASRDMMANSEKMLSGLGAGQTLSAEQQREADALTEKVITAWRQRKPG